MKAKIFSWRNAFVILLTIVMLPTLTAMAGVDDDVNDLVGIQNKWYFENQRFHFYPFSAPRALKQQIDDMKISKLSTTWTVFYLEGVGAVDMCESRGYGLPFGVSPTNNQYPKEVGNGHDANETLAMGQPDTDGLYKDLVVSSQTDVVCLRNGKYHVEQVEEYAHVYSDPVELVQNPDNGFYYVHHLNTDTSDNGVIDVDAINAESDSMGAPSEDFPGQ